MNPRKRNFLRAALAVAIGPGVTTAALAAPPMKVGFIFLGPVGDVAWTHQHDLGRQAMQKALGSQVSVRAVANMTEADARRYANGCGHFAASPSSSACPASCRPGFESVGVFWRSCFPVFSLKVCSLCVVPSRRDGAARTPAMSGPTRRQINRPR
jgi:hypothetical protein